jgi:hypothetical protein
VTQDDSPPRGALGHFAPRYGPERHQATRLDYEGDHLTIRDIATTHHISTSTVHVWARRLGWKMRMPHQVDPNDLVARMLSLLDVQILELETAMTNGTAEIAMLSKLVATLDRVLALKERAARGQAAPSRKVQTLRLKIADRLAELNRD